MIWLNNQQAAIPSEALYKTFHAFADAFPVSNQFDRFKKASEQAEKNLRTLLNMDQSYEFFFHCSGAAAIKNLFLYLFLQGIGQKTPKRIALPSTDEQSTITALNQLQRYHFHYDWIKVNESGLVTANAVEKAINNKASIVSLSWADGLTGLIHPLQEIIPVCQEKGALLHVNATHILGKSPINFADASPDFISFDGLPLHSLAGTGGIFIKRHLIADSLIFSHPLQHTFVENTFHPAFPIALGEAALEMTIHSDRMCLETASLRTIFEQSVMEALPESVILFEQEERLPNVSVIAFPNVAAETLAFMLYQKNIYASIGYGNFQGLSLVLQTCGLSPLLCHSAISFAFSRLTTRQEIDLTVTALVESITKIKQRFS